MRSVSLYNHRTYDAILDGARENECGAASLQTTWPIQPRVVPAYACPLHLLKFNGEKRIEAISVYGFLMKFFFSCLSCA